MLATIFVKDNWYGNLCETLYCLILYRYLPVLRIRICYYADPDPKNVHMDPDPRG